MTTPASPTLSLDALPALPQRRYLRTLARELWRRDDVLAIWLGGSFASGQADRYSDVDLRIAVPAAAIEGWYAPDLDALFDGRPLHARTAFTDERTALHTLLLGRASGSDAEAYDLWVQTPERALLQEPVLVLGCRDEDLLGRLEASKAEHRLDFDDAVPGEIEVLVAGFWDNLFKSAKVIHRDLDIVARDGLSLFGGDLLRLYFVLATGKDCGRVGIPPMTIHSITPVARTLRRHFGEEPMALAGMPVRTREEWVAAIDDLSRAMARLGRQVAQKLDFDYPEVLEAAVLESWAAFRDAERV